jgi:GMP synthase-like glutamine amidotransferase
MKIGILETGAPPEALQPAFGGYPAMFERLLGDGFAYRTFAVQAGDLPDRPEACDAYIVTGSSAGAYDPLPWIPPLQEFLRAARRRAALVGVCFGHQIMAQAFGGRVEKSDKGWGVGLHSYRVVDRRPWMDGADVIAVPASHQDQVVAAPPGARVIAASEFSPFGALAYDDQPAISIQLHPEFEPAYAKALIETRRARFSEAQAEAALKSLDQPDDRARVGGWIRRFLTADAS